MDWHSRFKKYKKGLNLTNRDIAEIIGSSAGSVKSATQPGKDIPKWLKLSIYTYENLSNNITINDSFELVDLEREFIYENPEKLKNLTIKEKKLVELLESGGMYDTHDLSELQLVKELLHNVWKKNPEYIFAYDEISYINNQTILNYEPYEHKENNKKAILEVYKIICNDEMKFIKKVEYNFNSNKIICRTIFRYAIDLWKENKNQDALRLYHYLFYCNPDDNLGIRFHILGILEGLTHEQTFEKEISEEYLDKWFNSTSLNHNIFTDLIKEMNQPS
jgi:hypothetical protein